jgi:hypothetical protein
MPKKKVEEKKNRRYLIIGLILLLLGGAYLYTQRRAPVEQYPANQQNPPGGTGPEPAITLSITAPAECDFGATETFDVASNRPASDVLIYVRRSSNDWSLVAVLR